MPVLRVILFIAMAGGSSPWAASQETSNPAAEPSAAHRALLQQYCFTCHNERLKTANLVLEQMNVAKPGEAPEVWEKVVRKLRGRLMPPAGMPRPDEAGYEAFAGYLETELDRTARANPNPGRPVVHRLNRTEYENAVRDLLAVEIDGAALLPADDAGQGFDNIAEILSVSPLLVERYIAVARKISLLAIGDPDTRPYTESYSVSRRLVQDDRVSEDLPFGTRGGTVIRHHFPLDGEYAIKVRLQRNNDNYIRGLNEPHQLDVRLEGKLLQSFQVGGEHKGRSSPVYSFINKDYVGDPQQEVYEFRADEGLEVRFSAQAGTRSVEVAFLEERTEAEGELMPHQVYDDLLSYKGGEPAVDNVSISGPYNAKGIGNTLSRQKIFVCTPATADSSSETACAKEILSKLARRAFRRPVTESDAQTLLQFYEVGRKEGGFEEGIGTAVRGILVSPEFLFRIERDPANGKPGTPYAVSDLELASRLSFFLWSSIPDDELLGLAEQGKLRENGVLEGQVKRMLADPRSEILVENFVAQWLGLKRLEAMSPDPVAFPDFDENLREALEQESILFAESIARENRSILDFFRADYTFLNERLARHYGIPNVYGSAMRRVELAEEARRGLMGQGSVLAVTSYANRTAPTLRGKWVLENVLGTPPPAPPPNVPSLREENGGSSRVLTMRERMEQHRANPTCAVCHRVMDPLGFALENFDAIGRWRDAEGTTPIDSSGVLPNGSKFNGPVELRQILLGQRELFARNLTGKLLMYALGRGLEPYDQPVVRQILREAAPGDYRWADLIAGIVKSMPFQMRRSR
jgi:mono/diheme cytochrome c family protein